MEDNYYYTNPEFEQKDTEPAPEPEAAEEFNPIFDVPEAEPAPDPEPAPEFQPVPDIQTAPEVQAAPDTAPVSASSSQPYVPYFGPNVSGYNMPQQTGAAGAPSQPYGSQYGRPEAPYGGYGQYGQQNTQGTAYGSQYGQADTPYGRYGQQESQNTPYGQYGQPEQQNAPVYPNTVPTGYTYEPKKGADGAAVASLILGIASIVFCWTFILGVIPSVIGLVLGIISSHKKHSGVATGGIIVSAIGLFLFALLVVVVSFATSI